MKKFRYDKAINYSGYRENQSPLKRQYPSKTEILEDLKILEDEFYYLRIYDCSLHGKRVLEVIDENQLNFKVMMGLSLAAEENHINHPYFYVYDQKTLMKHRTINEKKIQKIIELANQYEHIVSAVSIGNETRSFWNNNRVSEKRLVDVAKKIKAGTNLPVTFCEEYHRWIEGLDELAETVDFISLHTYPVWEGAHIDDAVKEAINHYQSVKSKYPSKYCIITETGWPTKSHGSKIDIAYANVDHQKTYNFQIVEWGKKNHILVYLFEAFDEHWKGEKNPDEPEKNWGIYDINRIRK